MTWTKSPSEYQNNFRGWILAPPHNSMINLRIVCYLAMVKIWNCYKCPFRNPLFALSVPLQEHILTFFWVDQCGFLSSCGNLQVVVCCTNQEGSRLQGHTPTHDSEKAIFTRTLQVKTCLQTVDPFRWSASDSGTLTWTRRYRFHRHHWNYKITYASRKNPNVSRRWPLLLGANILVPNKVQFFWRFENVQHMSIRDEKIGNRLGSRRSWRPIWSLNLR